MSTRIDEEPPRTSDEERLLDHRYDDIQEYDNPLPRWWVILFWATIVYSVLYWLNVPYIGPGKGRIDAYERDMAVARAHQSALAAANPARVETDATLLAAAHDPATLALGKDVFTNTCAVCHRADGGGNIGPNLTDAYWLHGGQPTAILHTVTTGVVEKGMPAWGQTLPPDKVRAAAVYVLTLRGTHPPNPKAPQGTQAEEAGEAEEHHGAGTDDAHGAAPSTRP